MRAITSTGSTLRHLQPLSGSCAPFENSIFTFKVTLSAVRVGLIQPTGVLQLQTDTKFTQLSQMEKRPHEGPHQASTLNKRPRVHVDTSKPSALAKPTGGRKYTVSIAIPGGIIANAQTLELKTALAGQIARAAAIFNVDEIVIFDEDAGKSSSTLDKNGYEKNGGGSEPNIFLARILQYLETPQYLRKAIFPMHRDLRFAGLLNPLDCPHHLRIEDDFPYREGITLPSNSGDPDRDTMVEKGKTLVECGLKRKVIVNRKIKEGVRVTLGMKKIKGSKNKEFIEADVVSPATPREKMGYYWGYQVRLADSISSVFTESPHPEGYDLTLGTSERGKDLSKVTPELPRFKHLLLVFGGLAGLEYAIDNDSGLEIEGKDAEEVFDRWINVAPEQGSRTIRTEEAVYITLAQMRSCITQKGSR